MIINTTKYILSPYSFCFFFAFILEFIFIFYKFNKAHIPFKITIYSYLLNCSFILYCGYMFTVMTKIIRQEELENIGFSSLGGVIGLFIGIYIFCKIYKKKTETIQREYILSLGLLYAISKLGCFFVGCCRGIDYNGFLKIKYITESFTTNWIFPVQLFESIIFFIAFLALNQIKRTDSFISKTIIVYALLKFGLDYLREYSNRPLFSINQIVCLIILFITFIRIKMKQSECKTT